MDRFAGLSTGSLSIRNDAIDRTKPVKRLYLKL